MFVSDASFEDFLCFDCYVFVLISVWRVYLCLFMLTAEHLMMI